MSLSKLFFSKNWNSKEDFPTYETREAQVRADIQLLYDEIQIAFNKLIDDLKASEVPFTPTDAIPETDLQAAIENVQSQISSAVAGEIPNRSLAGDKLELEAVGVDELADDSVTAAKLAAGSVSAGKLADNAVETAKIKDLNVTGSKIAGKAVSAEKIADGAVGSAQLGGAAIMTYHIGANAVTTNKIADLSVTEGKLAAGAVTTDKVGAAAVTTEKIADSNVTAAKIADSNVTAAKIADANVTTPKIADANITTDKLANGAVTYDKTSGLQKLHAAYQVAIPPIAAGGTVTVTVSGVTADTTTVIVSPAPSSFIQWRDCGVYCVAQGTDSLTFTAESATGGTLYAQVVILNGV